MKEERPFSELIPFLPPDTFERVMPFFKDHTIHLTLTRERKSVLGDYRNPGRETPYHRISINANLHPFSFLITLLHELAHMMVYNRYGHSVSPHGAEWKAQFSAMLAPYIGKSFFPDDVEKALLRYMANPKASTCTDAGLYKALHKYAKKEDERLLDGLPPGTIFAIAGGKQYKVLEKKRSRYRCEELATGKIYLFPAIYEVRVAQAPKNDENHTSR